MEIKGDLLAKRTVQAERRVDAAMSAETLSGNRTVIRHDYAYLNLDPNGTNRDVTLPDATTLPLGWKIGVRHSGSANSLVVKNNAGTTLKSFVAPASTYDSIFYEFILVANGTAAGSWQVVELGDPAEIAASRFVVTFVSGDWSAPSGGYRTLSSSQAAGLAASAHGRGANPSMIVQELSGSDYDVVLVDRVRTDSSGNVELRVVDGAQFGGRVILV